MKHLHFGRAAISLALLMCLILPADSEPWTRQIGDIGRGGMPFVLAVTSNIDDHLFAIGDYRYTQDMTSTALRGRIDRNNDFWPEVSYEVSADAGSHWLPISTYVSAGDRDVIIVSSASRRAVLNIDMEPFRKTIGKFKWGRVVLPNGQAAEFEIEDLLPPFSNSFGDFRQEIQDLNPIRFGSSFGLFSLTFIKGELYAEFVFVGPKEAAQAIKGNESSDGTFWPDVEMQVSDAGAHWKTIGRFFKGETQVSSKVVQGDRLERLRVPLGVFRNHSKDLLYGKVCFSNGQYSVFELSNLAFGDKDSRER